MTPPAPLRGVPGFFAAAIVLFLAIDLAADVAARVGVRGEAVGVAVREHVHLLGLQPAGTVLLALPFLGLAFIGLPLLRAGRARAGYLFLLGGALLLGGVCFAGYQQSAGAIRDRHWTAAALAVAFIPVTSLPVLLLACLIRRFGWREPPSRGRD